MSVDFLFKIKRKLSYVAISREELMISLKTVSKKQHRSRRSALLAVLLLYGALLICRLVNQQRQGDLSTY